MSSLAYDKPNNQIILAIFILGSKYGISQVFNVAYYANVCIFPVRIVASTYGFCNIVARICTIFAPYVAELQPEALSMWIFVAVCIIAFIATLGLKTNKKGTQSLEKTAS
jgi:hypothetical protein